MKKAAAETVESIMRSISAQIDSTIEIVKQEAGTDEEFNRYRRIAGKLMGEIFLEILQPIYLEHPDLTPPELRNRQS